MRLRVVLSLIKVKSNNNNVTIIKLLSSSHPIIIPYSWLSPSSPSFTLLYPPLSYSLIASSGLSLYSFPFSILLSFLVFVEGYLHSNNNTVARKLLKNLVFHTILRVISVIRSAPDSNNDVEKKITLFAATDLLFRMKNSLTIQQLIVS